MAENLNIQHKKLIVAIDNATIIQDISRVKNSLAELENVNSTLSKTIDQLSRICSKMETEEVNEENWMDILLSLCKTGKQEKADDLSSKTQVD